MLSAARIVERRCAMIRVVRPCINRCKACCTRRSESESNAEVASSKMSRRGSFSNARAMATRCFWPPESEVPASPTSVSKPRGKLLAKSSTNAASAAWATSASVAHGRP
mmetsp:Transcript_31095/g.82848  ORF Transcript_31095/g.82848 Transcript_31095/m.82848 type:complete len:109 (+) Transcript_31095:610-936(+)